MKDIMKEIRSKIAKDNAILPALHSQAQDLDLQPQPCWNADFYKRQIRQTEKNEE